MRGALCRASKGNSAALSTVTAQADRHAADVAPVIEAIRGEGVVTLNQIAKALNERGIKTPRDGAWYAKSVSNLLARIDVAN